MPVNIQKLQPPPAFSPSDVTWLTPAPARKKGDRRSSADASSALSTADDDPTTPLVRRPRQPSPSYNPPMRREVMVSPNRKDPQLAWDRPTNLSSDASPCAAEHRCSSSCGGGKRNSWTQTSSSATQDTAASLRREKVLLLAVSRLALWLCSEDARELQRRGHAIESRTKCDSVLTRDDPFNYDPDGVDAGAASPARQPGRVANMGYPAA